MSPQLRQWWRPKVPPRNCWKHSSQCGLRWKGVDGVLGERGVPLVRGEESRGEESGGEESERVAEQVMGVASPRLTPSRLLPSQPPPPSRPLQLLGDESEEDATATHTGVEAPEAASEAASERG